MDDIQISVVIPTYNRGKLALRAVKSALSQRKRPFEIIVVDDGSTDETAQLLEPLQSEIIYFRQKNKGSAAARHNGMCQAQCDWVALLDSDDFWLDTHLETMANAIQGTNGQARFYFADTIQPVEKGAGSRWEGVGFSIEGALKLCDMASDWVLFRPQPMMLQSTVFNKRAYFNAGGFLPALRYRDDTHLFLKLGLDGPVCAVQAIGTQMTSDDDPANRLTLSFDEHLKGAQMQVIMFDDLLSTMPHLQSGIQQELKQRLAYAHLAVARYRWQSKKYFDTFDQILRCMRAEPSVILGSFHRNFQKLKPKSEMV